MAPPHYIESLFAHMTWADERALASLERAGVVPLQALELLNHVLGAEAEWLARLEQRPSEMPIWPSFGLTDCRAAAQRNREAYAAYLSRVTADDLDRRVSYRNSRGVAFESRVEDILLHVAMHGSYHRGQVALVVRADGEEPNATDYIAFVRGAPAATRADQPASLRGK